MIRLTNSDSATNETLYFNLKGYHP